MVTVLIGLANFRSWSVVVRSSLSLFPVLWLDLQTLGQILSISVYQFTRSLGLATASSLFLYPNHNCFEKRSDMSIASPNLLIPHRSATQPGIKVGLVLKGPVLRTACGPENGPNWTETDQTFGPGPCFWKSRTDQKTGPNEPVLTG